jgi:hypothetical protein
MLWLSLFAAVSLGTIFGGWRSFRLAREGELQQAHSTLHWAALVAGVCGGLLPWLVLGWPWSAVTVSVSEQVDKIVYETVEVPVTVWKWFIWPVERMEPQEVPKTHTETRSHDETRRQFSWLLLTLMLAVGMLCYYAEKWLVFLAWRFLG